MIESNDNATMAGGRPKGGKDNPTNQHKMSHQTVAQQKVINEKNSKAKKAADAKEKRRQALEIKDKAEKERPTTSFFGPTAEESGGGARQTF